MSLRSQMQSNYWTIYVSACRTFSFSHVRNFSEFSINQIWSGLLPEVILISFLKASFYFMAGQTRYRSINYLMMSWRPICPVDSQESVCITAALLTYHQFVSGVIFIFSKTQCILLSKGQQKLCQYTVIEADPLLLCFATAINILLYVHET